jgi:PEP-CTERM motif
MRKALLTTTGLAWLALTGVASAAVTLTPGPQDPQYFASTPVGLSNFNVGTTVWSLLSGSASTEQGSLQGQYAEPLGLNGTTYLAVFGGGTEQASFATPQTSLSIYWGSIDPGNGFAVTINGYTLTGADLVALGATDDGSHTSPLSNQLVTISGLGPFTDATFSSSTNSFEFSIGSGVPEPSTWAMMALGFVGLGYAAFRRNSKSQPLAI